MSRPTLDTRVIVDGVTAYGTVADLEAGNPTVLDTIGITWGRATTVDQPDTGSCNLSFRQQLADTATTHEFDNIHVGSAVEIWVDATIPPSSPGGDETMAFPSFDVSQDPTGTLDPARWSVTGITATPGVAGTTTPVADVYSYKAKRGAFFDIPDSPAWVASFWYPPRPWSPTNNPDAWGLLPKLLPGGTWQLTATVLVPANVGPVTFRAAAKVTPQRTGTYTVCRVNGTTAGITLTADGAWHTITATIQLPTSWTDPAGAWIVPGFYCQGMPDQTTWAASTGNWTAHPEAWRDRRRVGMSAISILQTTPTLRSVMVWGGNVAGVHMKPAGDQAIVLEASCSDPSGKLNNDTIGDDPWAQGQTLYARAQRIQSLAHDPLDLVVDTGLRTIPLAYKDVDAQPVLGLLQDLATSGGGVLWPAAHAGAGSYLWMEDPSSRESGSIFVIDPATGIVTIDDNDRAGALLSSYDLLLDPIDVAQDSTNVITSVDITWQLMTGTDPDTHQPILEEQTHTETETDPTRLDKFGIVTQSIPTDLISETDAINRATRALDQARSGDWQLNGLAYDTRVLGRPIPPITDLDRTHIVLDLLDGFLRLGMAITLLDMPAWLPDEITETLYVEGGTYNLTSGNWELDLVVSPAGALGHSATWAEMPTEVSWSDMDWSISWVDAYGVAAPAALVNEGV